MTHNTFTQQYQNIISEFKKAIEPLQKAGVLTSVLFQFPQSFHYDKGQRFYLDALLKEAADLPLVIEMRNVKLQNENVYKELRQRKIGWCVTDNPALPNLSALDFILTADTAYFRLHGRNVDLWYNGDNVTRYDYFY